jgi:hypothetical protein
MTERIEVQRNIAAPVADIFAVLCDPHGHVAIDSSGMLQDADGEPDAAVRDTFVVHMGREPLNDFPELGRQSARAASGSSRIGEHLSASQQR